MTNVIAIACMAPGSESYIRAMNAQFSIGKSSTHFFCAQVEGGEEPVSDHN